MTVILKLFNMKLSISSLTFGILKLIFGPNEMLNWMHFFNWQKCWLELLQIGETN